MLLRIEQGSREYEHRSRLVIMNFFWGLTRLAGGLLHTRRSLQKCFVEFGDVEHVAGKHALQGQSFAVGETIDRGGQLLFGQCEGRLTTKKLLQ